MIKIHDIKTYAPFSSDVFFFDNNVWMFLFCPIANYEKQKQKIYSNFFNKVNTAKSCIWINSLVLSEFCNAWLRIVYNKWKIVSDDADLFKNNLLNVEIITANI